MRCEIVAVGTELLLGQIVDTNSSWLGEQLGCHGIDSHFQTKVGDNLGRIVSVLRLALERSDAVIVCGGLGPTQDDITREAIAEVMNVRLLREERLSRRIRARFRARGRPMPEINLRQADVPEGASIMPEMPGTAAGLICPVGEQVIYAVPGVPHEMQAMVAGTVLADLKRRAGATAVIRSRVVRTWGRTESALAELLAERIAELDRTGHATLAFLASGIEGIRIRITAKAETEAAAETVLAAEEQRLRQLLAVSVFGVDEETMESVVLGMLRQRGLHVGVAESFTGGLVSGRITRVPGASDVFRGGLVCYASDLKRGLLGVPEGPVVSEEAATAMALGVCELLRTEVGIATTGVAGPDEQEGRPVGTACLAVALSGDCQAQTIRLPGDRERIRQYAVTTVLNLLRLRLMGRSFATRANP